ncbi:hypothetical protein AAFF_G00331630, partial [Aldrovandia affinis]
LDRGRARERTSDSLLASEQPSISLIFSPCQFPPYPFTYSLFLLGKRCHLFSPVEYQFYFHLLVRKYFYFLFLRCVILYLDLSDNRRSVDEQIW